MEFLVSSDLASTKRQIELKDEEIQKIKALNSDYFDKIAALEQ